MNKALQDRLRSFALRWILLSAAGLAIGLTVGLGVAGPVETVVGMMLVTPVILALAGSLFGASQWLAVGKWHRAGVVWIVASAIALSVGMTLGIVFIEMAGRAITGGQVRLTSLDPPGRSLCLAAIGGLAGLAVGGSQRLALLPYGTAPRSWILLCASAFAVGLPAGALATDLLPGGLQTLPGFATFLGVAGLIIGALTAGAAGKIGLGLSVQRSA
jgi:hypothetical protein